MIDRKAFFDGVRRELGPLNQDQVNGFNAVLAEFERRESTSPDWSIFDLSYMLATAWWETGRTMQPVREAFYVGDFAKAEAWRKRNLRYYPFYGRGLVQLTWDFNYRKASQKLGIDFVKNPDRVMEMPLAVAIMFDGMAEGWFTAKALDDYIDDIDESDAEDLREYTNARRIINGTDKAGPIGAIAIKFERVLLRSTLTNTLVASKQPIQPPPDDPGPVAHPDPETPSDFWAPKPPEVGFWSALWASIFGKG